MKFLVVLAGLTLLVSLACTRPAAPPRPGTSTPTSTPAGIGPVLQVPGPGVATPDFTLPSAGENTVRLADYRGHQPVVLIFYRGFF